jgi:hypothetical protein
MKSRDYRILASVLAALVMVFGAVGWATAQAVNGSGTPNTIPGLDQQRHDRRLFTHSERQW